MMQNQGLHWLLPMPTSNGGLTAQTPHGKDITGRPLAQLSSSSSSSSTLIITLFSMRYTLSPAADLLCHQR